MSGRYLFQRRAVGGQQILWRRAAISACSQGCTEAAGAICWHGPANAGMTRQAAQTQATGHRAAMIARS